MVEQLKFVGFQVKDVMTQSVITVMEEEKVMDVLRMFAEYRVSAFPVVNTENEYIGVLRKAEMLNDKMLQMILEHKSLDDLMIKDILEDAPMVMVDEEMLVEQACDLMLERRTHRVFVKNASGRIIGVVSSYDVMKVLAACGAANDISMLQERCPLCGTIAS